MDHPIKSVEFYLAGLTAEWGYNSACFNNFTEALPEGTVKTRFLLEFNRKRVFGLFFHRLFGDAVNAV